MTVYEFTVADFISFVRVLGNALFLAENINDYIEQNPADMIERSKSVIRFSREFSLKDCTEKEQVLIRELFDELNRAYFKPNTKAGTSGAAMKASKVLDTIMQNITMLTRAGYGDVLNMGWSFYVAALDHNNELAKAAK